MEFITVYKDSKTHVVMAYLTNGELFYTRTYTYDSEGYVEKDITVFADGKIDTH